MFIIEMLDAITRKRFVACNHLPNEEQVAAINKTNNKNANITTPRAQLN